MGRTRRTANRLARTRWSVVSRRRRRVDCPCACSSAQPARRFGRSAGAPDGSRSRRHSGMGHRMASGLAETGNGGLSMGESFTPHRITGMAVDPIHVGAGGGRLGRVDQSIVRDPVTRVPKIPGSSLAGVYRAYAAMAKDKYPDCAGQGQPDKQGKGGHCGKHDCPICTVFGFARSAGGGFAGLAAFSDAHVLLFPVATREGPVWITCPAAMRLVAGHFPDLEDHVIFRSQAGSALNLGWLLLQVKQYGNGEDPGPALNKLEISEYIRQRLAAVSDKLFSHVVNSNLEVRTSVSIDPETGAAEERALFTYEAIPRAAWLLCDVVQDDYREGPRPWPNDRPVTRQAVKQNDTWQENSPAGRPIYPDPQNAEQPAKEDGREKGWRRPLDVVRAGLELAELLGLGGMGTRGFGRVRLIADWGPQGGGGR